MFPAIRFSSRFSSLRSKHVNANSSRFCQGCLYPLFIIVTENLHPSIQNSQKRENLGKHISVKNDPEFVFRLVTYYIKHHMSLFCSVHQTSRTEPSWACPWQKTCSPECGRCLAGVVASALMATPVVRHAVNILGVREAGTRSIMNMFADGFQVNTMLGHVSGEGRGRYSIASYVRDEHRQSLDVCLLYTSPSPRD